MSDILFDPGDLPEIRQIYAGQLSDQALYDYVVCVKRKEILAPNLPLAWQVYAVDGYDGGVLPLARYIHLQRLLLDEDQILSDGRLREGLQRVPPSRLLSILGVGYVLTDKVHDVWIDGVFYDLAFEALLEGDGALAQTTGALPGEDAVPARRAAPRASTEDIPPFVATGLGVVSYLEGAQSVAAGTPVAEVRLTTERGNTERFTLYAGRDTAEGYHTPDTAHPQARVGRTWPDQPAGSDYVTHLRWESPSRIARLEIVALPFAGRIHIRGLALIDRRDSSNVPVLLSTDGRFRQAHSGDVKIYEVLDALPRAHVVHQAQVLADDEAALAALADPTFDPAQTVVLADGQAIEAHPAGQPQVTVETYTPHEIAIRASLDAPGYLVLSDAWYPGWQATVDGQSTDIARANVHFRAVYLPAGVHAVRFVYRPTSYYLGLGISVLAIMGLAACGTLIATTRRVHLIDV